MILLILNGKTFGDRKRNIINLSDHKLSTTEEFVLSHGLDFCVPPVNVKREEVLSEFEVLIGQLLHHAPKSPTNLSCLKARLCDLARAYVALLWKSVIR